MAMRRPIPPAFGLVLALFATRNLGNALGMISDAATVGEGLVWIGTAFVVGVVVFQLASGLAISAGARTTYAWLVLWSCATVGTAAFTVVVMGAELATPHRVMLGAEAVLP